MFLLKYREGENSNQLLYFHPGVSFHGVLFPVLQRIFVLFAR